MATGRIHDVKARIRSKANHALTPPYTTLFEARKSLICAEREPRMNFNLVQYKLGPVQRTERSVSRTKLLRFAIILAFLFNQLFDLIISKRDCR